MSDARFAARARAQALAGMAGVLFGWTPDGFWRATPAELDALATALAPDAAVPPADRDTLERLMEAFPDG
ncbi:phage tail assembly chaperone [Sphingomonas baiyangensis]|uniref:Phage tail assembly chaperone n=1 Tax=Sphingomonas baiyangensis TaxID=2572576 RepID=A0A4U1L5Y6_9SPHN|nr:phage tail assembly chaperone [Sphingomonas baiyangensis]TKD51655.1 phage tail assembly chaperone [Sphingomonas baiyangensis]